MLIHTSDRVCAGCNVEPVVSELQQLDRRSAQATPTLLRNFPTSGKTRPEKWTGKHGIMHHWKQRPS